MTDGYFLIEKTFEFIYGKPRFWLEALVKIPENRLLQECRDNTLDAVSEEELESRCSVIADRAARHLAGERYGIPIRMKLDGSPRVLQWRESMNRAVKVGENWIPKDSSATFVQAAGVEVWLLDERREN